MARHLGASPRDRLGRDLHASEGWSAIQGGLTMNLNRILHLVRKYGPAVYMIVKIIDAAVKLANGVLSYSCPCTTTSTAMN